MMGMLPDDAPDILATLPTSFLRLSSPDVLLKEG
jgi:hypothetical protein